MNKYLALLVVGLLLVAACGSDPVAVAEQFQDAVNSQDIESALELLAEDAVLQVEGTSPWTGKAEIENWLATQAKIDYRIEGFPMTSEAGVVFEGCSISSRKWSYYGVDPMSATCEVALEGGLITSFAVQFDENSKAALSDSPAAERSDLAGIWTARGTEPESSAIPLIQYLQFSEDGTARWAVSPDDLQIPPDSEHRGAQFDWSYADYVLTVQNQGEASEGFCKAQDVGTFLVKKAEDAGIYFWGIGDTCVFRLNTWQRAGSDWFLYVP